MILVIDSFNRLGLFVFQTDQALIVYLAVSGNGVKRIARYSYDDLKHKNANADYFDQGIKVLEITQKLYLVYFQKDSKEKGELVNYYYRTAP